MPERAIGYLALLERHSIDIPRPMHVSWVGASQRSRNESAEGVVEHFPEQFARDDSDVGHLVFALKYDGVDLLALKSILARISQDELAAAVLEKPTSKYLRRLWFFWEWFHDGQFLDVPDCPQCTSTELIDSKLYFTRAGPYAPRQRVRYNLLGNVGWSPIVRRTATLKRFEEARLDEQARAAVDAIPPELLRRAVRYLYTKETRSSFEIERARSSQREERFVELLLSQARSTSRWGPRWSVDQFVEVQKGLLDERYASDEFRAREVRVSELRNLSGAREVVHWVGAKASDLEELMGGLCSAWEDHHLHELPKPVEGALAKGGRAYSLRHSSGDPFLDFVVAVSLSFGFVYIHPFDDGNGRTHRLLLHYVLRQTGFTPSNVVVPISSTILHDPRNYDRILEIHSERAMPFIDHEIAPESSESVIRGATADLYRYIDFTPHVEQLCEWFQQSVQDDLVGEIATIQCIDDAKRDMRRVVDMPDDKARLFLAICMENGRRPGSRFHIGKKKRQRIFAELTDDEVAALESAVEDAFAKVD